MHSHVQAHMLGGSFHWDRPVIALFRVKKQRFVLCAAEIKAAMERIVILGDSFSGELYRTAKKCAFQCGIIQRKQSKNIACIIIQKTARPQFDAPNAYIKRILIAQAVLKKTLRPFAASRYLGSDCTGTAGKAPRS